MRMFLVLNILGIIVNCFEDESHEIKIETFLFRLCKINFYQYQIVEIQLGTYESIRILFLLKLFKQDIYRILIMYSFMYLLSFFYFVIFLIFFGNSYFNYLKYLIEV